MSAATPELLLAASDVSIEAAADKAPTVNILAYTGGLMSVPGGGPLVIDLAGIDVSAPQVSILADHAATLSGVIGFGRATVSGGKLFARLNKLGFDVMTYRKGKSSPWPVSQFVEVERVVDGRRYGYRMAERPRVRVGRLRPKGKKRSSGLGPQYFWMREVRVLCDDGRQNAACQHAQVTSTSSTCVA